MSYTPSLFGLMGGTGGDVVVLGAPYDLGSTLTPGAARSPLVLRQISASATFSHRGFLVDTATNQRILDGFAASDAGNLYYVPTMSKIMYLSQLERAVSALVAADKRVVLLGGDHVVTIPAVLAYAAAQRPFQVVHLDAHTDYQQVRSGEEPTHATFVAHALESRMVRQWIQVGVRGVARQTSEHPAKLIRATVANLSELLIPDLPVYLTIDTDGFDPSCAPAVGHPVPGGLTAGDFQMVLTSISAKACSLIGADWVEYIPTFDAANYLTGHFVNAGILEILKFMHKEVVSA